MGLVSFEVCARYFFKHPTSWGWDITSHILGLYVLIAGVYTMSQNAHIKIDMIYGLMPPKIKTIARLIGLACFLFFTVSLVWKGAVIGWTSFILKEKLMGVFHMPLYPLKLIIPVIGFFFLLEGIAIFFIRKDEKSK
jgi:TRAP-type mannitol/chloroaromatic compound transport system permease small subunit